jgi:hypothetical protein
MRGLVAGVLFAVCSCEALAGWTRLGVGEREEYYADFSTVAEDGGSRYVWTLLDYRTPVAAGVRSMRVYVEFNCDKAQSRMRTAVAYASQMGVGRAVKVESRADPEWDFVPPGVVADALMNVVCKQQDVGRDDR